MNEKDVIKAFSKLSELLRREYNVRYTMREGAVLIARAVAGDTTVTCVTLTAMDPVTAVSVIGPADEVRRVIESVKVAGKKERAYGEDRHMTMLRELSHHMLRFFYI